MIGFDSEDRSSTEGNVAGVSSESHLFMQQEQEEILEFLMECDFRHELRLQSFRERLDGGGDWESVLDLEDSDTSDEQMVTLSGIINEISDQNLTDQKTKHAKKCKQCDSKLKELRNSSGDQNSESTPSLSELSDESSTLLPWDLTESRSTSENEENPLSCEMIELIHETVRNQMETMDKHEDIENSASDKYPVLKADSLDESIVSQFGNLLLDGQSLEINSKEVDPQKSKNEVISPKPKRKKKSHRFKSYRSRCFNEKNICEEESRPFKFEQYSKIALCTGHKISLKETKNLEDSLHKNIDVHPHKKASKLAIKKSSVSKITSNQSAVKIKILDKKSNENLLAIEVDRDINKNRSIKMNESIKSIKSTNTQLNKLSSEIERKMEVQKEILKKHGSSSTQKAVKPSETSNKEIKHKRKTLNEPTNSAISGNSSKYALPQIKITDPKLKRELSNDLHAKDISIENKKMLSKHTTLNFSNCLKNKHICDQNSKGLITEISKECSNKTGNDASRKEETNNKIVKINPKSKVHNSKQKYQINQSKFETKISKQFFETYIRIPFPQFIRFSESNHFTNLLTYENISEALNISEKSRICNKIASSENLSIENDRSIAWETSDPIYACQSYSVFEQKNPIENSNAEQGKRKCERHFKNVDTTLKNINIGSSQSAMENELISVHNIPNRKSNKVQLLTGSNPSKQNSGSQNNIAIQTLKAKRYKNCNPSFLSILSKASPNETNNASLSIRNHAHLFVNEVGQIYLNFDITNGLSLNTHFQKFINHCDSRIVRNISQNSFQVNNFYNCTERYSYTSNLESYEFTLCQPISPKCDANICKRNVRLFSFSKYPNDPNRDIRFFGGLNVCLDSISIHYSNILSNFTSLQMNEKINFFRDNLNTNFRKIKISQNRISSNILIQNEEDANDQKQMPNTSIQTM